MSTPGYSATATGGPQSIGAFTLNAGISGSTLQDGQSVGVTSPGWLVWAAIGVGVLALGLALAARR